MSWLGERSGGVTFPTSMFLPSPEPAEFAGTGPNCVTIAVVGIIIKGATRIRYRPPRSAGPAVAPPCFRFSVLRSCRRVRSMSLLNRMMSVFCTLLAMSFGAAESRAQLGSQLVSDTAVRQGGLECMWSTSLRVDPARGRVQSVALSRQLGLCSNEPRRGSGDRRRDRADLLDDGSRQARTWKRRRRASTTSSSP